MPKVKVKMPAKRLDEADVAFISLVERPANRIPFRILKSEDVNAGDPMTDLKKALKVDGEALQESEPTIKAIAVRKEDAVQLSAKLKEAGFVVDDQIDKEELVIFKQEGDFDLKESTPIKISDDLVVMVEGVKKYFEPYSESEDFNEIMGSTGLMPGIYTATDALMTTFGNILRVGDNVTDVRSKMKSAITQYSKYVVNMLEELPDTVFKLENLELLNKEATDMINIKRKGEETTIKEAVPGDIDPGILDPNLDKEKTQEEAKKADTQEEKKEVKEEKQEEVIQKAENTSEAEGEDTEAAIKEDPKGEPKSEVPDWLEAFKTEVLDSVKSVKEDVAGLKDQIEQVEKTAKSAKEAVEGTVAGSTKKTDEDPPKDKTSKGDDLWSGTALDNIVG